MQTNVGTGRSGGCSELILVCFAQQYDLIIGGNVVLANGGGRNGKAKCEFSWDSEEREKGTHVGFELTALVHLM